MVLNLSKLVLSWWLLFGPAAGSKTGKRLLKPSSSSTDSSKSTKAPKSSKTSKSSSSGSARNDDVTKMVTIGTVDIDLEAITSDAEKVVVMLGDVGFLDLTPTNLELTLPETDGETPTISIELPEPVTLTNDLAFTLAEFMLLQLKAAIDASNAVSPTTRRLDSPGCDLFPDAPCNLGCCATHDRCFADFGCDATSWARTACEPYLPLLIVGGVVTGGISLAVGALGTIFCTGSFFYVSGECSNCNAVATACIATGCSGISNPSTSELCYDNKCNGFFECPGDCPFVSLDDEACCGCRVAGASCFAPATCGNGICESGESLTNCYADCAYNTCPVPNQFECNGLCVDPTMDPANCGFCGVSCPASSACVLGKCSVPIDIIWSAEAFGGGGWFIQNEGKTIRYEIQDSQNCGGANGNIQSGTATAFIATSEVFALSSSIIGIAELQDALFENMDVFVDGILVISATSVDLDLECAMGPVDVTEVEPQPYILEPGDHTFTLEFTTGDNLFHVGAFYEVNLAFAPVPP